MMLFRTTMMLSRHWPDAGKKWPPCPATHKTAFDWGGRLRRLHGPLSYETPLKTCADRGRGRGLACFICYAPAAGEWTGLRRLLLG